MSINSLTVNGKLNTSNEIILSVPSQALLGDMFKAVFGYCYSRNTAGDPMTAGSVTLTQYFRKKDSSQPWIAGGNGLTFPFGATVEDSEIEYQLNLPGGMEIKYVVADTRPEPADTEIEIRVVFEETQG